MARVLINVTREPVYNRAGKLIGPLEHKDYVERPDPAPVPHVPQPQEPRRVVTMTTRELGRVRDQALTAGVPEPPNVLEAVPQMQREQGRR